MTTIGNNIKRTHSVERIKNSLDKYNMDFATYSDCKYYLYRHVRLDTNEVFYVGVGTKVLDIDSDFKYRRAFEKGSKNTIWKNIYKKCKANIKIDILFESDSREEIFKKEIEFVKLYGRKNLNQGTLSNLTNGGLEYNDKLYKGTNDVKVPVFLFNIEGFYLQSFASISELKRFLKIASDSSIHDVINEKRNSVLGYFVKRQKDYNYIVPNKITVKPNWRTKRLYGKVNVIYLDSTNKIYNTIEDFCKEQDIKRASVFAHCKGHTVKKLKNLKFNWI